jgi:hypothetical protein
VHTFQCGDGIGPTDEFLTSMQFYFHDEAIASFDYVAPAAVIDLAAASGDGRVVLRWTSPGDDEWRGRPSAYDLRCSSTPITPANFGSATPIPTGPPDLAGTQQCAEATGLTTCRPYWFAIRTRDDCNTWSSVSNVVMARPACGAGQATDSCDESPTSSRSEPDDFEIPRAIEFALGGSNPVVGPSAVAFGIPASMAGQRLEISIFDLAGRRVRILHSGTARAGRFRMQWNQGAAIPSGAYFLAMRLGEEARVRKLILVR